MLEMSMTEVGDVLRLKDKRSIDYQGSEHMIGARSLRNALCGPARGASYLGGG
jgi:hypothetical protein